MTKMPSVTRVCWVVPNLVHYHAARWAAFARQPGIDAIAIEIGNRDLGLAVLTAADDPGFQRHTLFSGKGWTEPSGGARRSAILRKLDELSPNVVCINGWSMGGALAALAWAQRRRRRAILMSDSNRHDHGRAASREALKRRVVRLCDAAMVGGTLASEYANHLGMPAERISVGYDVVDNAHFAISRALPRAPEIPSDPYFLAVARFGVVKNHARLLEAYARYREHAGAAAWPLVLLGDGELRRDIENLRSRFGLETGVLMPGPASYDALPAWYARAGCLVLPSISETWGLVVNEAMAAGLPVIVSNRCGCAPDLVEEGGNGFTVDPHDTTALAQAMYRVAHGAVKRVRMGQRSREIIADWGPERFASGLRAAVEAALAAPRRKANLADRALLEVLARR